MPTTVAGGFSDFLATLTPSSTETALAASHRSSIETCLKNKFGMTRFFRSGSFGNGTSIKGYSDVDYFAVIPSANLNSDSGKALTDVKDALTATFPTTSGIRVSCPAVRVPFGTYASEAHEIIPARGTGRTSGGGYNIYGIADGTGGWKDAGPDAHTAYVRDADSRLSNKVKPLIRFIKAWKYYCNVPIMSFYLELRVAKYSLGESSIVYATDVKRVFKELSDLGLAAMQDPMGISGLISPCTTTANLDDGKSKLSTALTRAEKALAADSTGNVKDAFSWWSLVFGGKFPSYG